MAHPPPPARRRWLGRPAPLARTAALRGLRQPVVGASLAAAAAVLALATAGTPLYRVAVGNTALASVIEGFDDESLGLTVGTFAPLEAEPFGTADRVARAEGAAAGLEVEPFATVMASADAAPAGYDPLAPPTAAGDAGDAGEASEGEAPPQPPPVRPILFFARDEVTAHLPEPRPCPGGDGVWVSTRIVASLDLGRCDPLRVVHQDRVVDVPVAGTYRDLTEVLDTPIWQAPDPLPEASPIARYWQRLGTYLVRLSPDGTPAPQPPLVVAEPHDFAALGVTGRLRLPAFQRWTWPFPLEGSWYLHVQETSERYQRLVAQSRRVDRPFGEAMVGVARQPMAIFTETLLPTIAGRTDALVAAVGAAMEPLGLAVQVAAALVVAAAGVFEGRRRRTERLLLAAQGVTPAGVAGRTALEALLPVAAGTAAGTALATVLVGALAPGAPPDRALVVETLPGVAAWAAAAVVLLAVTSAAQASGGRAGALPGVALLRRRPWELVPLVLAGAALWTLLAREEVLLADTPGGGGPVIDASYVLFPVLLLLGCGGLAARLLPRAGAALPRLTGAGPPSLYLAVRRLARAPAAASLLVAGTATGVGLLVYAGAVGASTQRSTDTALELLHGAPTVADLGSRGEFDDLPGGATVVARDRAVLQPRGTEVDLLTVDPATFAGAVAWRPRFADRGLAGLLATLERPGDSVPVLLVGTTPGEAPSLETSRYRVPIDVVARPSAFPGMSGQRPLVVASTAALVEVVNASGQTSIDEALMLSRARELWTVREPERVPELLRDQPVQAGLPSTVTQLRQDRPQLVAATWALRYLQGVGAAAGLLGLVALALYLYGQQRGREVAYVLLRRLGLSRGAHRRAVMVEAATLVATAILAGALPATAAAWVVVRSVRTLPQAGPPAEFVPPWGVAALLVPAALAVCLAAAWASQRAADRAPAGELLRAAD